MSTILVTGASGFIGQALVAALKTEHRVIAMSRKVADLGTSFVRGDFGAFEDLRQLDGHSIDTLIHLGAVTGGCSERDGILVNVEGTRCLMRYLIDRGCRKFVMASSIAAVGMQSLKFRPQQLPIPDEHPCLDRDGYGLSKYLMEEITKYHIRQNDHIDVINLRLSSVLADEQLPAPHRASPLRPWALGGITLMGLSDAVRVFVLAAQSPLRPGLRILNATGPQAWVANPVAEVLRGWWGDDVDLAYYKQPGHEFDSVYAVDKIQRELGFVAQRLPQR